MRKLFVTVLLAAAAALALTACGGSSSSSSPSAPSPSAGGGGGGATGGGGGGGTASGGGGGGSTVKLSADPSGQLAYQQKSVTAKAGKVTVDFTNDSPLSHNVTIEDSSGKTLGATPTGTGSSSTTVNLKPGTYKFLCTVDGHAQAGMEGTLKVQ